MSSAAVAELVRRWDSLQQQAGRQQRQHRPLQPMQPMQPVPPMQSTQPLSSTRSGKAARRSDSSRFSELAEVIAKEAFRRGSTDNISVIVVALQWEKRTSVLACSSVAACSAVAHVV